MKEYFVASEYDREHLMLLVKQKMSQGWVCVGGIDVTFVSSGAKGDRFLFAQAMVK